jgi:ABC-2 type transport system ATP-binding protein
LWGYVRELNRQGVTVLLTTHYLEEAEELCDRIAIINHGKVIACESKEDLLARVDSKELVLTLARDIAAIPESLKRWHVEGGAAHQLKLRYRPSETKVSDILDQVRANQLEVVDLTTVETDLEDIFLQLTRRSPAGE